MIIKKLNAIFALLAFFCVTEHAVFSTVSVYKGVYETMPVAVEGLLLGSLGMHFLLTLCVLLFCSEGASLTYLTGKNYLIVIQRISAVVIVFFVHVHILTNILFRQGYGVSGGVVIARDLADILFYASIAAHILISVPKALVTLGLVKSEKRYMLISKIFMYLCIVVFLFTLSGVIYSIVS